MVFSSAPFIFIFLPVVFLLYAITPGLRLKNAVLTIASLLFYAYGEPAFALVMIASVVLNYVFARLIATLAPKENGPDDAPEIGTAQEIKENVTESELREDPKGDNQSIITQKNSDIDSSLRISDTKRVVNHTPIQKFFLFFSVFTNLALIGLFKYAAFFVRTVNGLTESDFPIPDVALPIGISFFTFQALSYVVDVYRDPGTVQKNLGKVMLYISFFPQLIAGPIVKYHDIAPYLDKRHADIDEIADGVQRFVTGLAKKMFLSNSMGLIADTMFDLAPGDMSQATAWTGAICFALHIYFDFSGYSDMAIGIGHMFGFTIKENFDHPYQSCSIKEFWRRWHISLSTWFKEYLYIPLGGNRHGIVRTEINKLIVFFTTGLWHGANWTFVVWGMLHGAAITFEDVLGWIYGKVTGANKSKTNDVSYGCPGDDKGSERYDNEPGLVKRIFLGIGHLIGWAYTIVIVIFAFVFFRADTISEGIYMVKEMIIGGAGNAAAYNTLMEMITPYSLFLFALALFLSIQHKFLNKWLRERGLISYLVTAVLFGLTVLEISGASFNPFIYFRF